MPECDVQDYAWGDPSFIPSLTGALEDGPPQAELSMGAHPKAPSKLVGEPGTLADLIASNPATHLGESVAARFGELPFLAKVLAAGRPLSIQTHPSTEQAAAGFAREELAGLPLDSPHRT